MNPIRPFLNHTPQIHESCLIDETSVIIGEVSLAEDVSVWPYAVLRGDVNSISIGARSNVQDGSVLHVSHKNAEKPEGSPLVIGEDVTVGHKVMLHGCRIGDRVLIGMGTIILDDTVIEDDVMIGAGQLGAATQTFGKRLSLCRLARQTSPPADRQGKRIFEILVRALCAPVRTTQTVKIIFRRPYILLKKKVLCTHST